MIIALPDSFYIPHGAVRVISERKAREMNYYRSVETDEQGHVKDYLLDRSNGNKCRLQWREGILTLPVEPTRSAKQLKISAELKSRIKSVLGMVQNQSLAVDNSECYVAMTEQEWQQAYAAGSV